MPRIVITGIAPGTCSLMSTFGTAAAIFSIWLIRVSSISRSGKAVMLMPTSVRLCSRRCAVTMISSSSSPAACVAWAGASWAQPVAGASAAEANKAAGNVRIPIRVTLAISIISRFGGPIPALSQGVPVFRRF